MIKFSRLGVLVDWRISDLSGREDFFFYIYLSIYFSFSLISHFSCLGGVGGDKVDCLSLCLVISLSYFDSIR